MLSKNRIKYINSLKIKKYRQLHEAFVVEGAKSVLELFDSDFEIEFVLVTQEFQQKYSSILTRHNVPLETVTPQELEGLGSFQTNDSCLAVAKTKENAFLSPATRVTWARLSASPIGMVLPKSFAPATRPTFIIPK